ncbi:MAG: asparagine synthase (glutamine-hydrolyzing), partial [Terriglobales bacterium]
MCGIAALLGKHKPESAAAMVHTMNDAQAHRGPDDQGAVVLQVGGGIVGLGNRRLAILDLSPHGHQPMHNPDTGDVLVYNGEIYNSPDLRRELQQAGFTFRGHSDTEVLLRAYQHWGVDCLPRLRGMFAFALWDARRSRLLIARDHLGIKPLYYAAREGEWFVCASEVRALMSSGLAPPLVSQRALAGYLAYGAVQEPLTLFEGVFTLPRGAWKELDSLGRATAQGTYWQFPRPDGERKRSLEEVAEEGRALLEQSVRRHLLSDVRVGIFLSSGLDSTAVLGIARQFQSATDHLNAFTVS